MKKYLYEQAQLESDIRVTDFLDSVDPKEILNGKYSVAWKNRQLQISNLEEINNEIENLDIEIRELKELILEN